MGIATAVHITDGRKKDLLRRARKRRTTLTDELNSAIDLYLELPPDVGRKELEALVQEANASMDRSIARLDEAIPRLKQTSRTLRESDRKLDELDRKNSRSA